MKRFLFAVSAAVLVVLCICARSALADRPRSTVSTAQSAMRSIGCDDLTLPDAGWLCTVGGRCRTAGGATVPCDNPITTCSCGPLNLACLTRCRTEWHNANTE